MFMKKLSFFSSDFKNSFQNVVCYRKLGCLTLWYWIFPLKGKNLKTLSILSAFAEIKNILNFSWIKYFGNYFSKNDIYGSATVEITARRTWKLNWKQSFDSKLVYILGKTDQGMVLDSYLRQIASSQLTSFWCFWCYFWNQ